MGLVNAPLAGAPPRGLGGRESTNYRLGVDSLGLSGNYVARHQLLLLVLLLLLRVVRHEKRQLGTNNCYYYNSTSCPSREAAARHQQLLLLYSAFLHTRREWERATPPLRLPASPLREEMATCTRSFENSCAAAAASLLHLELWVAHPQASHSNRLCGTEV